MTAPGEFIIAGPGGPGESEAMECPVPGCWWTDSHISGCSLEALLEAAQAHLDQAHPS